MVGAFDDIDAAFRAVLEAANRYGIGYVATWALECEDNDGRITTLGEGERLVKRAREHVLA